MFAPFLALATLAPPAAAPCVTAHCLTAHCLTAHCLTAHCLTAHCVPAPCVPAHGITAHRATDDLAVHSARDGWCLVMEVLDRFRAAPYGLTLEGAHVPQRTAWVGEPLAEPSDLPPLPIGARSVEVLDMRFTGGGMGEEVKCSARLALALQADDTLGAALLLEHLLAHFEALPGVSVVQRPETVPRAREAGLSVPALHLRMDLARFAPQRRGSDERFVSTAVAVRAIGLREGSRIHAVRFSPGVDSIADDAVHSSFSLTPARPATEALPQQLFHLLARLEATDPELWSARIELGPPGSAPGSAPESDGPQQPDPEAAVSEIWRWKVQLESQRPFHAAPAPAPPSVLDALIVLREVLAGFRADPYGVSVTGIFPDRARTGAGQRPPALSASGLRQLVTAGGYGIEVRSLSIEAARRASETNVELTVDLRCTSEGGVVEGTRLFEFLSESLRSQPELESMNQPQVVELADGSGVFVSGLRLTLVIPVRPAREGPGPERPATNPLTHIRSTAALDGIDVGSLRIVANRRRGSRGLRTEYRLWPLDKQASFELPQVLGLFWTLEREEPGYTLSSLEVKPAGRVPHDAPLPGRWVFEASLATSNDR